MMSLCKIKITFVSKITHKPILIAACDFIDNDSVFLFSFGFINNVWFKMKYLSIPSFYEANSVLSKQKILII